MDTVGNTVAVTINLTLKENGSQDDKSQKQQDAKKNAFAVGDKRPPAKSTRINPKKAHQEISINISEIKSNSGAIDSNAKTYLNNPSLNAKIKMQLDNVSNGVKKLLDTYNRVMDEYKGLTAPIREIINFASYCNDVKKIADRMINDIIHNNLSFGNPAIIPNNSLIRTGNDDLQKSIKVLSGSMGDIIKSSILRK
jgi:hypothetical protein